MATYEEALARIQSACGPKRNKHIAIQIWSVEDIFAVAEEEEIKVSLKKANEILDKVDDKQDAEAGINWETISYYLDPY